MKLGPAHAAVVATSDQIQVNNFVAEAMDGRPRATPQFHSGRMVVQLSTPISTTSMSAD
jgi:hypothetical protein